MASLRTTFEQELRRKLKQKAASHQSEEQILLKSFKYFDLNNSGDVDRSEFIKVIEKIGIPIISKSDISDLFNYYDLNNDGHLDYKEFSALIFGTSSAATRKLSPQKVSSTLRVNDYFQAHTQQDAFLRLQQKLKQRGLNGVLSLANLFKSLDNTNSRTLDLKSFSQAIRQAQLALQNNEIEEVFDYFDLRKDRINYDEFLLAVRGPLPSNRSGLIRQVFVSLDRDNAGSIGLSDICNGFNASMHPDVRSDKFTEQQVFQDFTDSLEAYVAYKNLSSTVSLQDFLDYYAYISAQVERDTSFELFIKGIWGRVLSQTSVLNHSRQSEQLSQKKSGVRDVLYQTPQKSVTDDNREYETPLQNSQLQQSANSSASKISNHGQSSSRVREQEYQYNASQQKQPYNYSTQKHQTNNSNNKTGNQTTDKQVQVVHSNQNGQKRTMNDNNGNKYSGLYQRDHLADSQQFKSPTTQKAPFGTSNAPLDYSTNLRPNTSQGAAKGFNESRGITNPLLNEYVAAGNPSWPGYNRRKE